MNWRKLNINAAVNVEFYDAFIKYFLRNIKFMLKKHDREAFVTRELFQWWLFSNLYIVIIYIILRCVRRKFLTNYSQEQSYIVEDTLYVNSWKRKKQLIEIKSSET